METRVIIVGAGAAGLRAARVLQDAHIDYLLLDREEVPGGRIKTDFENGFTLDHGFQIVNTAYPEFENCGINLNKLNLKHFASGAKLYYKGKAGILADPFREKNAWLPALLSPHASFKDLWLVNKLRQQLKRDDPATLLEKYSENTATFLSSFGFSNRFVQRFFVPFYSGIFLERELNTPAGMFAFVFSMFDRGYAALPQDGMSALPQMMCADLPPEKLLLGHEVTHIEPGAVITRQQKRINAPFILLSSGTSVMNETRNQDWKGNHASVVFYYSIDKDPGLNRFIGLNAGGEGRVNLFSVPSNIQPSYAPRGKTLLSVSLWPGLTAGEQDAQSILHEVETITGRNINGQFLKSYHIPAALPELSVLHYEPRLTNPAHGIWAGGDFSGYPSLNAALRAGTLLAQKVIQS